MHGRLITGDELAKMGDLEPCELVEGKIVATGFGTVEHGIIEANIAFALRTFVQPRRLGTTLLGGVGVFTRRDPDTVRSADVLYISNERYAQIQSATFVEVAPELIVEVLSPDDRWSKVTQKMREYFTIGVELIWIVDPQARTVYAYRSLTDVREFKEGDVLPGDEVLPGFSLRMADLFSS